MLYLRILLTLPYFLLSLNKARRQCKQIKKNPNIVPEENRYYWVQKQVHYLFWLCNLRVIAHDIENWPDRGCLLVGNHQSYFDPCIILFLNDFNQFPPAAFLIMFS